MAITPATLSQSVIAVPPLARRADLSIDRHANAAQLAHLRRGGVTTVLWGGNANLYHMGVSEFGAFLDLLEDLAEPGDWHIPSIGADFGKAMDQARLLRSRPLFTTAMALPMRFPVTPDGVADALPRLAEAMGKPVLAYVKDDGYIDAARLGALVRGGTVSAVKYGTVKDNPANDPQLAAIVDAVGPERVVSGIGERPVIDHFSQFGLRAFTSGSVCVAPRLSTDILGALKAGDRPRASRLRELFLPLEDLRDAHSPLRVLHEAVRLAGIADTGPMLPMLSSLTDAAVLARIGAAARALLAANADALTARAA
jgi:dihydrodipicolinate synthase/N-acetylneuraminate lyase